MRDALSDGVLRMMARTRNRREVLALSLKGAAGVVGLRLGLGSDGTAASSAVVCGSDWPTWSSLTKARKALAGGATKVFLSPGGCVQLTRTTAGGETDTIITFNGTVGRKTQHLSDGSWLISEDSTLAGSFDSQVSYTAPGVTPLQMVRRDYSQATHKLVKQTTVTRSSTAAQVVEEVPDSTGHLTVLDQYNASLNQPASLAEPAGDAAGESPLAAVPCSAGQLSTLNDEYHDAYLTGLGCMKHYGDTDITALLSEIRTTRNVRFLCPTKQPPNLLASVPSNTWMDWGGSVTISVYPNFFTLSPPEQVAVIFHELQHVSGFGHNPDEQNFPIPNRDEADRIYACTVLCFGEDGSKAVLPTRCTCAKCLETNKCDPRCTSLTDCSPGVSFMCPCPQGPNAYKRFPTCAQCLSVCPSGLSCFGYSTCYVIGDLSCKTPTTCP
jgi:hypothetical protein